MRTEEQIRTSIKQLANAPMWTEYAEHEIALAGFRDYMVTWAERIVFNEHADKRSYYCTKHKLLYLQDISVGDYGAGCPQCTGKQLPADR